MAVENCRRLKQGDCKNAFYNARLPDNESTIIKPPSGDPDAKKDVFWLLQKTLYGLGRSPRYWYKMVNSILVDMGLKPSLHNPCLFQGIPSSPDSPSATNDKPLHLALYVEDFVYFSEDSATETRFERLLAAKLKVEFMGDRQLVPGHPLRVVLSPRQRRLVSSLPGSLRPKYCGAPSPPKHQLQPACNSIPVGLSHRLCSIRNN